MSTSPNEHCSDLEYARSLSQRLRSGTPATAATGAPRYVRFEPRHALVEQQGASGSWTHILEKCLHESAARAIFLMDAQGLIIAVSGEIDPDRAQEIGARLQPGLDQTERINGSPEDQCTLCVQLNDGWVDATRFSHDNLRLTLGLLAPGPISKDARASTLRLVQLTHRGGQ